MVDPIGVASLSRKRKSFLNFLSRGSRVFTSGRSAMPLVSSASIGIAFPSALVTLKSGPVEAAAAARSQAMSIPEGYVVERRHGSCGVLRRPPGTAHGPEEAG